MIRVGKIFAERYMVIKEIGRGGMANVYLAEDRFLDNRLVAIKVLRSNFENDSIATARFQREAYAMSELTHPNIVGISDVGDNDKQQYIVMEYVAGKTLKEYIQEKGHLSNEEAIHFASQILSAMQMAHDRGIIHRDLKPQNILISEDGNAKVTDFGIAMAFAETSLTQTNSMFGSVHYLSPEQARGSKATVQSDIYAIGIVLYEMLVGDVPFDGDSAVTIALQHFQKPLPSIRKVNSDVPQALENVAIKATAKSLDDRYKNVSEMLTDLSTSTSLDRKDEPKLVFIKEDDEGATKVLPRVLVDKSDTEDLVKKVSADTLKDEPEKNEIQEKKEKKNKRKLIIGAIIAAVLALIIGLVIVTTPKDVRVPEVNGMTVEQAKDEIKKAGLEVGKVTKEINGTIDKDKVIRTNPTIGTSKKTGSKIDIFISMGPNVIELSNYVGQSYDDAVSDLVKNFGISQSQIVKKVVTDDNYATNEIISQDPKKNEFFDKTSGDKITFKVSDGGKNAKMPELVNSPVENAKAALNNMGVPESNIKLVPQKTIEESLVTIVTDQNIATDSLFNPKKDKIVLHYYVYDEAGAAEAKRAAEAEKKKAEDEAKKKAEEEAKKKAEDEAKKKAEDDEAKKKADDEAKKKAEEEAKKKAEADANASKKTEEDTNKKTEDDSKSYDDSSN
ncbi:Stk1 family PASTA domain-containing Ser/Thr kinase [Floricoccus penangensis]|uniref:Stk1 family PASTA domain-containing Ser/Thr kinase n=1 Tax=Floricoccus penangensis TaxID=1859475 RepID=UPI00203D68DA|nr:Stk1 family PASTA domain-containing Ser/Thr kinase [Floricoccus penangensis]URZ86937.1 Stk1 family PASTA domain-containing Ser/Thr kinase [Floricoccus penangensis]